MFHSKQSFKSRRMIFLVKIYVVFDTVKFLHEYKALSRYNRINHKFCGKTVWGEKVFENWKYGKNIISLGVST